MGKKLIGNVILRLCSNYLGKLHDEHSLPLNIRRLGDREILVYNLSPTRKKELISYLYNELLKYLHDGILRDVKGVSISHDKGSLIIETNTSRSYWYRLGLALSDGTSLSRSKILFSTTTAHTLNSILYSFGLAKIYVERFMIYRKSSRRSCAFNVVISDEEVAKITYLLKNKKIEINEIIKELKSQRTCLVQFLAGVIDGDGIVDKDSIRISLSKDDTLFDTLFNIIRDIHGNVNYDSKRYLLRLSTRALRKTGILNELPQWIMSEHKRLKMKALSTKKERFDCKVVDEMGLDRNSLVKVIKLLRDDEIKILKSLKFRSKDKYEYAYFSSPSSRLLISYSNLKSVLSKISSILCLNADLSSAVKLGNREVIIYAQCVVKLLKLLVSINKS